MRSLPRDPDHERIHRSVEVRASKCSTAKESFGMSDRGRACERCRRGQLSSLTIKCRAAHRAGEMRMKSTKRRTSHTFLGLRVLGVAAVRPGDTREVEDERDADEGSSRGNCRLNPQGKLPLGRPGCLEE
jgi:hypothetical protein